MKINRFLYISSSIYGVLITCLILASLLGYELFTSNPDRHLLYNLVSSISFWVLTTVYWAIAFFIYERHQLKQQAETELILNRFQLALEASQEALWDWTLNENEEVYFSAAYCANLGYSQEEFGNTQQAWRNHIIPEVRDKIYQNVMRFLDEGDGRYEKTYRMLHRDQSHRWIRSRGHLIKNAQGKPIRFIGIARDVTEQYAAEVRLQQAKAVFELTREAVLITDHKNNIVYVNPSFTRITGYSEQEVIGKTPGMFKSKRHTKDFYQDMWSTLKEEGLWSGEIWNCRKNGELLRQFQAIRVIKNENGIISHFVAVFSDISTIDDSLTELSFLSLYDPLTSLANRTHLCERLKISLNNAKEKNKNHALFMVGVDDFKSINGSLGHNLGDQLLKNVALRLKESSLFASVVARTGGDEFALVFENITNAMDAVLTAESIIQTCKAPFMLAGNKVFITVSIGICLYPYSGTSVEEIMRNADSALHKAKDSGRETFAFYSTEMTEKAYQRMRIVSDLRLALERNELELHYQPIYRLNQHKLVGCEALVRWNHPQQGRIAPNDFIPIAEESGLISAVDAWVLREACEQMHKWQASNSELEFIAVNLSSRSLCEVNLANKISSVLQQSNLEAKFLELEVTESAVMENPTQADAVLSQLQKIGIRIAIDDFGTGFSSLGRLKSLPVNKLKIDQSFIQNLSIDTEDAAIVNAILALGISMGLKVQAEGIELSEQVQYLQDRRCDLGQGYFLGRPMLPEDFSVLLESTSNISVR